MIRGEGKKIIMTEGDFGLSLPITISGPVFESTDKLSLIIKKVANGTELLKKEYSNIEDNKFDFVLTEEETKKLSPCKYGYTLDWYRNDEFLCNIVKDGCFIVEDKY